MITKITIENFKGISEPVEIPLRPITLLFGKNSAGKSTILQAMLYALEIIRTGNADVDRVQLGGEAINLGGFRNLIHKHDSSKRIRLKYDLQLDEFGLESYRLYDDMYEDIEDDALGNIKTAYIELEISQVQERAEITSYSVGLDGVLLASILRIGQYSAITNINMNHSLFKNENDTLIQDVLDELNNRSIVSNTEKTPYGSNHSGYADGTGDGSGTGSGSGNEDGSGYGGARPEIILANFTGVIPVLNQPLEFMDVDSSSSGSISEENKHNHNPAEMFFSRCLVRPVEIFFKQLNQLRYIGPIREIPDRSHSTPLSKDESRWSNGLAAWDALYSVNEAPLQKEHFMAGSVIPRLNSRDVKLITKSEQFTLQKVNEYIRDVLQLGYEICREDSVAINVNHEIFDLLDNLDEAQISLFQSRYAKLREYMLNCPVMKRLYLYDLNNKVEVSPSDIGVGISQVVPVVTGVIAPNPDGILPSIIAIEQPELHIHPAVQCALGDLFIREMSDNRIFLIETHSEHLILRFLRRIRENNEMLKPEQMSVIYVLAKPEKLELTPLAVTDDGDFEEPWPEGFFDERDEELF